MTTPQKATPHCPVIIVGGGQAGLSLSFYLTQQKIEHLIFEEKQVMHTWNSQRWDSFTLVTPNWQCQLPGHHYDGDDPQGFMNKNEIIQYLQKFKEKVDPPVKEGVRVKRVTALENGHYQVSTSDQQYTCEQLIIASGGYRDPIIPRFAEKIPTQVMQLHSAQYKNPEQLPEGNILVVGSGQSGAQIAEDLHLANRQVYLATGGAPRVARQYRGKDVVEWLNDMSYYNLSVYEHPLKEGVRDNTNHYVTGRDGGHEIDLRKFAMDGMELFGLLDDFDGNHFRFKKNLAANLDHADSVYNNINSRIDAYIEEKNISAPPGNHYSPIWQPPTERETLSLHQAKITSVVWCIGFHSDFSWIDIPVFNGRSQPNHIRGVTTQPGLYFLGLPWLHTWGSGRFSGIQRDAEYLSLRIQQYNKQRQDQKPQSGQ